MAAVNFSLTSLAEPPASSPAQQGAAPGPQPNTAQPQTAARQQDTVTLAGRSAESQQTASSNGGAQFGETASYYFAERQSFRASNGSASSQTADRASVPTLPVKLSGSNPAASQQNSAGTAQAMEEAEAESTNTSQAGGANGATNAQSTSASSGAATSQTPIAELAQLDSTLQEIGVNPQSISVFSRMAMLLYANDPAALRMLVQTLQSGAQLSSADSANSSNGRESNQTTQSVDQTATSSQVLSVASGTTAAQNSQTQSTANALYLQLQNSGSAFGGFDLPVQPSDQSAGAGQLLNVSA
jgi:hypothetical protein